MRTMPTTGIIMTGSTFHPVLGPVLWFCLLIVIHDVPDSVLRCAMRSLLQHGALLLLHVQDVTGGFT